MVRSSVNFAALWSRYCNLSDEASARRSLWRSAGFSLAVYFLFAVSFAFLSTSEKSAPLLNALLIAGLAALLASYYSITSVVRRYPHLATARLVILALVASLIALITPNFHSKDIYTYMCYGWEQANYHQNPYTIASMEIPGFYVDRMLETEWYDTVLTYGFVFAHIIRSVCWLGHGNPTCTFALFKVMNWCVYALLALTLHAGARKLKLERPELTLHLFLWSPLVLLQALSNAHNDLIMSFIAVVGLFAAGSGLVVTAMPLIVTAALIKYVWFISAPFLLVYAWQRRGWKAAAGASLAGGATFLIFANPYIWQWQEFRWKMITFTIAQTRGSLHATIRDIGLGLHKCFHYQGNSWILSATQNAVACTKILLLAAFIVYAGYMLERSTRDKTFFTFARLLEVSVLLITLWICLVNAKFFCWYLLMVFPAALWLPEKSEVRRLVLLLSFTHVAGLSFLGQSHIVDFLLLNALPLAAFAFWRSNRDPAHAQQRAVIPAGTQVS